MNNKIFRHLISFGLVLFLVLPVVFTGCSGETPTSPSTTQFAATLVPNVDLDLYFYFKQDNATKIPLGLIGASGDISVESLSVWGIAHGDDKFTIGGALNFTAAADASKIGSQLSKTPDLWTQVFDRTVFFVRSVGDQAENLKAAITKRDFKAYNDGKALQEVNMMPSGGSLKLAGIGVIKPNQTMINLIKKNVSQDTAGKVDMIFNWGKPEVITIGMYSSNQIEIGDIMQKVLTNKLGDADLGVYAAVKSSVPGAIVSPIANKFLGDSGYPQVTLGQLTVYKVSFNAAGRAIPVLVNVDGNHIFATISAKESYSQTMMTSIKR